tara:strand:+ start:506 stop:3268 length:2763 start_codon:yes stop_codon:yes gene_type:complete
MEYVIQNLDFISLIFVNLMPLILGMGILDYLPGGGGGTSDVEENFEAAAEIAAQEAIDNPSINEDSKEYSSVIRLREQCYLLKYWHVFNTWSQAHDWAKFHPVTGNPATIVNMLRSIPGQEKLLNLTPQQLSLMVPKIQIFKTLFRNEDDPIGEDFQLKFTNNWEDRPIERDDTGAATEERGMSMADYLYERGGRGAGVGLKSFSFQQLGGNPAQVTTNLVATLKLHFQNLNDLFKQAQVVVDNDGNDHEIRFIDLVSPVSKYQDDTEAPGCPQIYNNDYYRIKIILGWTVPQAAAFDGDPNYEELKIAAEKTQTILFLSLRQHEIDFKQNGTVEFTIHYIASIEAAFQSEKTNILSSPSIDKALKEIEEEKDQLKEDKQEAEARLRDLGLEDGDDAAPDAEDGEPNTAELIQEQIEALDQQANTVKSQATRKILNQLHINNRIKYIDIDKTELGYSMTTDSLLSDGQGAMSTLIYQNAEGGEVVTSMTAAEAEAQGYTEQAPSWATGGETSAGEDDNAAIEEDTNRRIEEQVDGAPAEEADDYDVCQSWNPADWFGNCDGPSPEPTSQEKVTEAIPEGKHRIYYIYFGDILESVLEILDQEDPTALKGTGIMAGPFTFQDIARDARVAINIADVPISLNLYRTWFLKNASFKRTVYLLKYFLSDMLKSLIQPALGKQCWDRTGVPRANYNFANLSVASTPEGADPIKGYRLDNAAKRIPIEDIKGIAGFEDVHNTAVYSYLLLQSQIDTPCERTGDIDEDQDDGIFHLGLGQDRGLVKQIKFNKLDQPMVQEARMSSMGSHGFLREVYDANVSMVGNTLFEPGAKLYINPSIMGLSSVDARFIGLGGYYDVITIDNNLSPSKFETNLVCRWQSAGAGCEEDEDFVCPNPETIAAAEPETPITQEQAEVEQERAVFEGDY